jgi:hypothetical protein
MIGQCQGFSIAPVRELLLFPEHLHPESGGRHSTIGPYVSELCRFYKSYTLLVEPQSRVHREIALSPPPAATVLPSFVMVTA